MAVRQEHDSARCIDVPDDSQERRRRRARDPCAASGRRPPGLARMSMACRRARTSPAIRRQAPDRATSRELSVAHAVGGSPHSTSEIRDATRAVAEMRAATHGPRRWSRATRSSDEPRVSPTASPQSPTSSRARAAMRRRAPTRRWSSREPLGSRLVRRMRIGDTQSVLRSRGSRCRAARSRLSCAADVAAVASPGRRRRAADGARNGRRAPHSGRVTSASASVGHAP